MTGTRITQRPRTPLSRLSTFAAIALISAASGIACAQAAGQKKEEPIRPPIPTNTDNAPAVVMFLAFVLIIGGIAVSLMPAKRGHQD
jgi:hypothetical protein